MSVETELKLIVTPAAAAELPALLSAWPGQHDAPQTLTNIYYETADNQLRNLDIGLRIRGADGQYEMTLKTAGKVLGGLHQRPEYNVALAQPVLDLSLLPAEVWPVGLDIAQLQQALQPRFRTDFVRERWQVSYGESDIELAFDRGAILAGELQEPLCELELELKKGNTADLLALAGQLAQQDGLRLGSQSKAARGYRLAQGCPVQPLRPLTVLVAAPKASVEQGMVAGLELALAHWQYHEELWLQGESAARLALIEAVVLVRQVLVVFGGLVPRKASTDLRAKLLALETALQERQNSADALCYRADYLQARLALVAWLAEGSWRAFIDAKAQAKLAGSFKRFADIMLGRSAADLKAAFGSALSDEGYRDRLQRLQHQILALHLLSGAYAATAYQPYIGAWQALEAAINQHQVFWIEAARKQAISQTAFWLNGVN